MRDSLYKKNKYPTQARGLFTHQDKNGKYSVKIRGYDKFFNANETNATQWHAMKNETVGPYEITAKENGCIIFITATTPTDLVATSKHSIPEPKNNPESHGGIGYEWLLKQLNQVNCKPHTLASWIYDHRVTLICELCDDSFEEHVVPYSEKESGLYLHGINYNTTSFHTLPMDIVHRVAQQYGFRIIDSITLHDFHQVETLANQVKLNTTGMLDWMVGAQHHDNSSYNNEQQTETTTATTTEGQRESEGIVIRCKRKNKKNDGDIDDFLFKVKNDTYLLYRDYREVTKALIHVQGGDNGDKNTVVMVKPNLKPIRYSYEKTLYYIHWLMLRIKDHPEWFIEYQHNKGIVAVRQAFEKDWDNGLIMIDQDLNIPLEKSKSF
ncbi:unnamed protein product [Cunninghamella echinulata]